MDSSVLAAQMYTVRDFMQTPEDSAETFKKIADIGYQTVELAGFGGCAVPELADLLSNLGLTACSAHVGFAELRDNPEREAEYHRIIGCEWIGTGGWERDLATEQDWVSFAKEASEVARVLAPMGLKYVYHNHSHEFEKFGDRTAFEILVEESDPECFYFELDTYWVQDGGASPVAWIEKLGRRVPLLHVKDMTMRGREQLYAEVGEGNLDWEGILTAAADAAVQWYIVEQDICQRDPFESLAISFNNLKAMGLP